VLLFSRDRTNSKLPHTSIMTAFSVLFVRLLVTDRSTCTHYLCTVSSRKLTALSVGRLELVIKLSQCHSRDCNSSWCASSCCVVNQWPLVTTSDQSVGDDVKSAVNKSTLSRRRPLRLLATVIGQWLAWRSFRLSHSVCLSVAVSVSHSRRWPAEALLFVCFLSRCVALSVSRTW